MKNKGFTLLELLVVVAILGSIGLVVTVSLNKTLKNTNQEECDAFVTEVEDAACVYVTLSRREHACSRPGCELPLSALVTEGMVDTEKNACTGEDITKSYDEKVKVTWDDAGNKTCEYLGVKDAK